MQSHGLSLFAASLLAATLSAQVPEAPSPDRLPTPSFDLATQADQPAMGQFDGAWWGSGADYTARFADDGLTFTPNIDVPGGASVRFEFESARRAGGEVWSPSSVEPTGDTESGVVHYRRGGLVERYELRGRDVEQSFVFERLPQGSGDLVVRLRTETALTCTTEGRADAGFAYDSPGFGRITVGRVVGIDGNGKRADGWIRVAPGRLELGLPQRFVDESALPLTLDPPIGSTILVESGSNGEPDVAYDVSNDMYLVAWVARATQSTLRARRVASDGRLLGGTMMLGSCDEFSPVRVANINDRNSFVVVFRHSGTLKAKRVLPNGGVNVNPITIATNVPTNRSFDVGGDMTTTDNDAIVVWGDNSNIRAAQIEDSPSRGFHVFGERVIQSGSHGSPAIAKSGGSAGRYLIVFTQTVSNSPFDTVIRGVVIDRNLVVLDSLVQVTPGGGEREFGPVVDGDGLQWVVSYTRGVVNGDDDVMCRSVQFHPARPTGTGIGPEMVIEADPGDAEFAGSVAWLGDSALVSYREFNGRQADVYGKTVDPFTCTICETQFTLEAGAGNTFNVRCASTRSGGANDDRALIVWDSGGPIRARRFLAEDGIVTDVGGGCGNSGTNYATCARVGQSAFRFRLREAFNATGLLLLGADRIDASCGPCRLVPDPTTSVMVLITTNSAGRAELAVPIPSSTHVRGIVLYSQWFLFQTGAPCVALPGHFSNALAIGIQ